MSVVAAHDEHSIVVGTCAFSLLITLVWLYLGLLRLLAKVQPPRRDRLGARIEGHSWPAMLVPHGFPCSRDVRGRGDARKVPGMCTVREEFIAEVLVAEAQIVDVEPATRGARSSSSSTWRAGTEAPTQT